MSRFASDKKYEFKLFGHKVFELTAKHLEHSVDEEVTYDSIFYEKIKKYIENNN